MTHTLVTILGKARRPDGDAGYNEATYLFPDGTKDRSAFFGLALARHLKPEEIVILGTASSMWSVLVQDLAAESGDEDGRNTLAEAENDGTVNQRLLDRVAPLMERALSVAVRPTLIPPARDEREQYAILEAVNEAVAKGKLDFDLTHGFRHLGMVGFLSSFMLERLYSLKVRGLWYGALDMTQDGITPVLRLDGLMRVRRWLDALDRFDATGDYGVFAPLLREDGVPDRKANCLEEAAFFERTLNVRDAAKSIATFRPVLDQRLAGASGLFQDRLGKRLRWANAGSLWEQQRELADQYLKRRDFLRAAAFGREACVGRLLEENEVPTNRFYSEERAEKLKELADGLPVSRRQAYRTLAAVRNALVHGTRPFQPRAKAALRDPRRLREELQAALKSFFDDGDANKPAPPYHAELRKVRQSLRGVEDQT